MKIFKGLFVGNKHSSSEYDFRNLLNLFFESIAENLIDDGFIRKGFGYTFYRQTPFGNQSIHFNIAKHDKSFDILPSVEIRFDEVETFINKYTVNRDLSTSGDNSSVGQTFGELCGKPVLQWKIQNASGIKKVVTKIVKLLRSKGFSYFDRINNLDGFWDALNNESDYSGIPSISDEAIYSVALAHIIDEQQLIPKTITKWKNYFMNNLPQEQFFKGFLKVFYKTT